MEEKTENNEEMEKSIKKAVYHIAAGSILLIENNSKEDIARDIAKRVRGSWKVIRVGKKHKDWQIESLLRKSNGFFKGAILGKMPKDRVLIIENADAISERNLKMIRYFYDENSLKAVAIITEDSSMINNLPDAIRNRVGNRIIKVKAK